MLSRTADHLYWMARYIERAENMARALDVTYQMSLVPKPMQNESDLWMTPVLIAGDTEVFEQAYPSYTAEHVMQYMIFDENNPSSIVSAFNHARENARSVRVTLSSEMWESINSLWLELQNRIQRGVKEHEIAEFCDWIKSRSHLFRGVTYGTMLRDTAYMFVRLGTFIERADDTARLLDVKYHVLLPQNEEVGGAIDYYEWSALLRSASSFEAYQKVFRDTIEPWKVAELLVLRDDVPRSLHACFNEIATILENLCRNRGRECLRKAGEVHARLHYGRMNDIFQEGLHEFLETFIEDNNALGSEIQQTFLNVSVSALAA
jgi:uncharacterized alpha-E superfamily protein